MALAALLSAGPASGRILDLKDPNVLKIYKTGELTVVGFGGQDVPDEVEFCQNPSSTYKINVATGKYIGEITGTARRSDSPFSR